MLSIIPNAVAAKKIDPKVLKRSLRVAHCLEIRCRELRDAMQKVSRNTTHSTLVLNTLVKLQGMKKMIEDQVEA